jgi:hypothetical protein
MPNSKQKETDIMKRKLKGIAILLFALILILASMQMNQIWPGEFWILFWMIGIIVGVVGLVVVLTDDKAA